MYPGPQGSEQSDWVVNFEIPAGSPLVKLLCILLQLVCWPVEDVWQEDVDPLRGLRPYTIVAVFALICRFLDRHAVDGLRLLLLLVPA